MAGLFLIPAAFLLMFVISLLVGMSGVENENFNTAFSLQFSRTDGDDGRIVGSDSQSVFDGLLMTSASNAPGPLDTQMERLDINLEVTKSHWSFNYWSRHLTDVGSGPGVDHPFGMDVARTGQPVHFVKSIKDEQGPTQRRSGSRAKIGIVEQSDERRHIKSTEHGPQQFHGTLPANER